MSAQEKTAKQSKKTSVTDVLGMLLGGLVVIGVCARAYEWVSGKSEAERPAAMDSDSAAINRAEQIIHGNLVNPDSYQRRSASVVWKGSTRAGKPMFGVKVDYNVQNAFGGTIRKCEYIFYFRDGDNLRWEDKFGREPCDAVQYFNGDETAIVNQMAKVLVEQHY